MKLRFNYFKSANVILQWQGKSLLAFALFNQNIPYILWDYNDNYSLILFSRVFSGFLAGLLYFAESLFQKNLKIKFMIWNMGVLWCLVITPLISYVLNYYSYAWLTNYVLSLLVLPTLVAWYITAFILALSLMFSFLNNSLFHQIAIIQEHYQILLYSFVYMFFFVFIIARDRDKNQEEKHKIHDTLSNYLAHELRTPLATLSLAHQNILKDILEIKGLNNCKKFISEKIFDDLINTIQIIEHTINTSNNFITTFIIESKKSFESTQYITINLKDVINEAITTYPMSEEEKKLINYHCDHDVYIKADPFMIQHVVYNLIKNSLYYINQLNKGQIYLTISKNYDNIVINFRDTAKGINEENIKFVFDHYFTDKTHGSGIGLAFCRDYIEYLGGNITCDSKLGEYIEFKITLKSYEA